MRRAWAVPVIGAALTGVLSSGVTALYLRSTFPDVLAIEGDQQLTSEQRHLAALLVAPAKPFAIAGPGKPVDARVLGEGLDALEFQRGWTQTWRTPDKQKVDAFALEFRDETGARSYARGIGNSATLLTQPRPFEVPDVPGSIAIVDAVPDRDGNYAALAVLHQGSRAVFLVFATKQPGAGVADLVQRQWRALLAT